ncbi:hypothetical protein RRG08_057491 [Elysia crispata]|uniref:Uncharacterized protein n=1 Tax=Elysia crispata TaxID=231223 RepID=A0AAE0ZT43_9GAST|nr:hypothetical protein RRG08_057491 [Elysia crispata]
MNFSLFPLAKGRLLGDAGSRDDAEPMGNLSGSKFFSKLDRTKGYWQTDYAPLACCVKISSQMLGSPDGHWHYNPSILEWIISKGGMLFGLTRCPDFPKLINEGRFMDKLTSVKACVTRSCACFTTLVVAETVDEGSPNRKLCVSACTCGLTTRVADLLVRVARVGNSV